MSTETITRTDFSRKSLSRASLDKLGSALSLHGDSGAKCIDTGIAEDLVPGQKVDDDGKYPYELVTDIDSRDAATPDAWIPRHSSLIRLTGRSANVVNLSIPCIEMLQGGCTFDFKYSVQS